MCRHMAISPPPAAAVAHWRQRAPRKIQRSTTIRSAFAYAHPPSVAGSDRHFRRIIKKVQTLRVQREPHPVVNIGADMGLDRGDHCVRADRDVEQDLGAELLDDLDNDVETELRRIGGGCDMEVFRTDPQSYLLPDIAA